MVRAARAQAVLALGLLLTASAVRAQDSSGFFDGNGAAPSLPADAMKAVRAAAAAAPAADDARGTPPTKQSGKDLYYFTKEEAAAAAKRHPFHERSTAGLVFDRNVPADIQAQMRADLAFMKGIQGSGATPLHQKIFGAVDGASYFNWFDTRVASIGMNDCGSAKAVACVIPFRDSSKMWLTQNFVKFSHPQISRLMIVYHEARHTETRNGNWSHATCPDPFLDENGKDMTSIWTGSTLAGEPACDVTPLGSYGSSTILLKNVQKYCANCTDKVKMDAGLYADDQMGRIIDPDAKKQMLDDFQK